MKFATCGILVAGVVSIVGASTGIVDLSYDQLIAARNQLDSKKVSIVGYFDATDVILGPKRGSLLDPIAIELTRSQIRELKRKQVFRSGYVRIVGRFEYAGDPIVKGPMNDPERRILVSRPAGYRGGYSYRITKITGFEIVPNSGKR